MRLLTKSRFKLGLECPNKIFYTRKKEYVDNKTDDPFLSALADGGFQVEEYARMHYPGGTLVDGTPWEYEERWQETQELLKQENVIIYEAAFLIDGLFIRVDILEKKGDYIKLIEVKSKTFDPVDEYTFVGKKGGILSAWRPYLMDVAFQKHVMQLCFPEWRIDSYLLMADKTKTVSIDGLNQVFRIKKSANSRTGVYKLQEDMSQLGNSVLGRTNISDMVRKIEEGHWDALDGYTFLEAVVFLKDKYATDTYADCRPSFAACKSCEFKAPEERTPDGKKSGYHECFKKKLSWTPEHFARPNNFDIWDFRVGGALMQKGIIFKDQLTEEDLKPKPGEDIISRTDRQWIQIQKDLHQDDTPHILREELQEQIASWTFPLNFIDFETNTVALPFHAGRKPYEAIAFQYSHHILYEDSRVVHASEYINATAGEFPNFDFVRNLMKDLSGNEGSIFRYSNHENTILNAIYFQLLESSESDKLELMDFIEHISHSGKDKTVKWSGPRDMIDQWDIIKKYYYNPLTKGSNSLKAVLPAILSTDIAIQEKYAQPLADINVTSTNFPDYHIWLTKANGQVINPYKMLPPMFQEWFDDQIEQTLSEMEHIGDGGAAMIAYAKLQYYDMTDAERQEITHSLLRYCELDTLAMVMVHEHLSHITP